MRSFRTQIVLWIAAVVTLALVLLGFTLSAVNISQMQLTIDRGLRARGELAANANRPPGGPFQPRPDQPPMAAPGPINMQRPMFFDQEGGQIESEFQNPPFDPEAIGVAIDTGRVFTNIKRGEVELRVYTIRLRREGPPAVAQLASDLEPLRQLRAVQTRTLLGTVPAALLAAIAVALFLSGRVMKPIGDMRRAAKSIADGDYSARIEAAGQDEFAQMGEQFNQMAGKVEASVVGLQAALKQQKQFTADASHELRTPLTRMQLATSAGLEGTESEAKDALKVAGVAAKDMSKLVDQLLELARADTGDLARHFQPLDLRLAISEAIGKVEAHIDCTLPEAAVMVKGDAGQLERVFVNIIENARRHGGGEISISLVVDGSHAIAEVQDRGPGIPPEHIPHLTERFYRVDSARDRDGGGTGLGLAIVDEIVRAHGGALRIESEVGAGTRVAVKMPVA